MIKNSIQKIIFASILCTLCLNIYAGHAIASGGPTVRFGTIAAKGLVLGANDKPIWAEYDERGQVLLQRVDSRGDSRGSGHSNLLEIHLKAPKKASI